MHRDITAAMRIVNTETFRVLSRLDTETCLRIAMRARNEGRIEAVLPVHDDQLRKLTAAPDPKAPVESWDAVFSVNGKSLLALSNTDMAGVANVKEFAPVIRTMAQRIFEFVGDGPNEAGQHVAFVSSGSTALSAADTQQIRNATEFLTNQTGFEAAAALIRSILL